MLWPAVILSTAARAASAARAARHAEAEDTDAQGSHANMKPTEERATIAVEVAALSAVRCSSAPASSQSAPPVASRRHQLVPASSHSALEM